ncbi:thiol:disulfide interchange protein DsbG [Franzmannia qiaohouensis]|uniref:Thiol:disulfide interchange protein n=1 Tax=Franzmannia qiaohouensis TaxID=1329370 RepID=A0ABU1HBV9_9GAMM|nr:thiol:disulfide interchange protein DsbG [Halomonas qiaohouensis]MDR5904354.1 thiol:disulfide interchange protein DsbG [Halomonas qiaohouensis]
MRHPLVLTSTLLAWSLATPALADDHWPAPVQALAEQGLMIHTEFDAPGGLRGFASSYPTGEATIYLMPDGEHAIVGTLVDEQGSDLSSPALDRYVRAEQYAEVWQDLEASHWIADGDPEATRIVYTFTDPNCPFCRQLWQATRPWVDAGEVQLRHVMVGILRSDSPAQAAVLLGSDDPTAALDEHQRQQTDLAIEAQPRAIEEQVYTNNQLFESLGFMATPTTLFQAGDRIERIEGMPDAERLEQAMGGPAP